MTIDEAKKLAQTLRSGRCHAVVRESILLPARIHFTGGLFGEHSLDIENSTEERVIAHWRGYCACNFHRGGPVANMTALLKVGDRVRFDRGMFGRWDGVVTHLGEHKKDNFAPYATVSFRRRNGSTGALRIDVTEITR